MAITKQEKAAILAQYRAWLGASRAAIITEYTGLTMKQFDELRQKLREVGSEYHVIKNTLGRLAFEETGYPITEGQFSGSTAVSFAFEDAPLTAKIIADFVKTSEFVKLKGGYLGKQALDAGGVVALAELPPLPVMRARLLGTILAPASKLVRTLAEPARQVAAVVKAYSERESAAAAA